MLPKKLSEHANAMKQNGLSEIEQAEENKPALTRREMRGLKLNSHQQGKPRTRNQKTEIL